MSVWTFIGTCLKAIVPPADASPAAVYRYRVAISFWVLVLTAAGSFHIALACGYFAGTIVSFPGFARADAVEDIKRAVAMIQVSQLDSKIVDDQTRFCKAQQANNGDAMRETEMRLYRDLDNWHELVGKEYRLPPCSVMLAK